jgi:type II secretory pathway pseudopilin PulG
MMVPVAGSPRPRPLSQRERGDDCPRPLFQRERGGLGRLCKSCAASAARGAFTLVEALVAIAITAIAGSVLLAGMSSALQTTDEALKRTIAAGMAEQLIDEVLGGLYFDNVDNDPYQLVLGRSSWENQGSGRERYNDIDDYHLVRTRPPTDLWGVALGRDDGQGGQRHSAFQAAPKFLQHWRQEIDVYYVAESDLTKRLPAGATSAYRAVEVRIVDQAPTSGSRELARIRRVVAYVPPP